MASNPSTTTKPTVFLIHGAFHKPDHYAPLLNHLTSLSYPTLCPPLPTCNNHIPPTAGFTDDVSLIRTHLSSLIDDQGKDVVVIAHSYGGAVATEALSGFGRKEKQGRGERGGVVTVVWLCAFVPEVCRAFGEWARGGMEEKEYSYVAFEDGVIRVIDPVPMFFEDLDEATRKRCSDMLVVHSMLALAEPITREAWREIPSTYLVCRNDKALPESRQVEMTEVVRKEGADMVVEWCDEAHSPFASAPGLVVEVVERAVERVG